MLANEEVTPDGRSDRGNFPVYKRPLTQWMMRITAFADRLLDDLDGLDWPEPVKLMQRNWIGRSTGARVRFATAAGDLEVFTTRPDTLFGATFMVVAPEHAIVDQLVTPDAADAVAAYRAATDRVTEQERTAESREKTGVFIGAYATNPVNGAEIPIFIADYVLAGYGTGAIMAVPAEDERDWAFAKKFDLPDHPHGAAARRSSRRRRAYTGDGVSINSDFLNGMTMTDAKAAMIAWLEERGVGEGAVTTKLRDWLFSRQRYWGEPFPIVYDTDGLPRALPESMLPVELPELDDFAPRSRPDDPDADPEPPLGRAEDWVNVELDLGDGVRPYLRETNTMPQWAGSCWYYLRYLDPTNENEFCDPVVEKYWMGSAGKPGGVDLYVGGVEHAVLHLLYSRFWHKVLFDLGYVSTPEPFQRLFNQGMIQAAAFTDAARHLRRKRPKSSRAPTARSRWNGQAVNREFGKMGKSLKNAVTPDDIYESFGADTLRVYEMAMGPLDASRPWRSDDIVGAHRLLQRTWRADHRRGHRRPRRHRRRDRARDASHPAPHDRRGHRGLRLAALQHRRRAHHRTGQPPDEDRGVRTRDGRARWRCCWRRWRRTSPRSCGSGWVTSRRSDSCRSPSPIRPSWSTTPSRWSFRSTARCASAPRSPTTPTRRRSKRPRWRCRASSSCSTAPRRAR